MSRLHSQLAMELWILRPYARQFATFPALGLMLGFLQDTTIPVMVVMAVLTGSYGFSITENARLETLFATLPTSRRCVVLARYLVVTGLLLATGLLGFGFDALISSIRQLPWSPLDSAAVLGASLAVAGLVLAIQFPFYFKLGYTRAKIITWVVVGIAGALLGLLGMATSMAGSTSPWWTRLPSGVLPTTAIVGGPLLGAVLLAASAATSVRIYSRKDL